MKRSSLFAAALFTAVVGCGCGALPGAARAAVRPHTFQGGLGWQMVSAPGITPDTFAGLGVMAYALQPSTNQYVMTPAPPADTFLPGQGYWVYLTRGVSVSVQDVTPGASGTYSINIKPGWNQVGNPFPVSVPLSAISILNPATGTTTPLPAASATVSPLYAYDPVGRQYVVLQNASQTLEPWLGCWIYTLAPATLVVALPSGTAAPPPAGALSTNTQHNLAGLNAYRVQAGVAPLTLDDQLTTFATAGNTELMQDHIPHQHFRDAGASGALWTSGFNTNAAENQGDPNGWTPGDANTAIDQILQAMIAEGPGGGHHDTILNPGLHRVGIGLEQDGAGRLYLTNDFSD